MGRQHQPRTSRKTCGPVPKKFVDFCTELNFNLHPGQRELCRVLFDGGQPKDTKLFHTLFGPLTEDIDPMCRRVVTMVCGGRAGKTRLLALRILHLALTVDITKLAPGEQAYALFFGPKLEHTNQAFNYVVGALEENDVFAYKDVRPSGGMSWTGPNVTVMREDGEVLILCVPADARGSSGRGKSLVGAAMDELAFFKDSRNQVNDRDIIKAVRPRILLGGQLILSSTPWGEGGECFQHYQDNFGKPRYSIVAKAPTLVLNPDKAEEVALEFAHDEENARKEFNAEFGAGDSTHYFPKPMLDSCAVMDADAPLPWKGKVGDKNNPPTWPNHYRFAACMDVGFKRDASALVIWAFTGDDYKLASLIELRPEPGKPLQFGKVMDLFITELKRFGIESVGSDAVNREAIRDYMSKAGIFVWETTTSRHNNQDIFGRCRRIMGDGTMHINVWQPETENASKGLGRRVIQQLSEVRFRHMPGGDITLEIVRKGGTHGELAICTAGCIWKLWRVAIEDRREQPEQFTEDWYQKKLEREVADMKESALRQAGREAGELEDDVDNSGWLDED